MRKEEVLTSSQNPKIKEALALQDRRVRDEKKLFLIEGYRELLRAQEAGVRFHSLFFCPELFLGKNEQDLIRKIQASQAKLYPCAAHLFEKLSYRDRPDGLVAVAEQMENSLEKIPESFLLIAEAIEKPGNLGSMLRSADAAGVDGVIVCDPCTDIYNPNVVRASVGTLFTQPVVQKTSEEVRNWLKEKKIKIVAATPDGAQEYTECTLTGKVAIVVGTEQLGLSEEWLDAADLQVRIPMKGKADSLNVGAAATILLYEVLRQRRAIHSL